MSSRDEILIERLKKDDRDAQREFYDRFSASLMAISVRYMGNREVAEDVLHDALIKIFRSVKRFKYQGEGAIKAWASRIVVNTALEELRRNKRVTTLRIDSLSEDSEPLVEGSQVEQVPREVLLGFVAELPDGYRTVFNMFYIEGYSHREIADQMGINEKSSSSQLLRAKRLLATKIKNYIDENE